MDVGSQLRDAQQEILETSFTLGTTTPRKARMVYVAEDDTSYVGDGTKWVRSGGGGTIGDLKTSILSEANFIIENGSTWVLADGQDVTGSDYTNLTGLTVIPDYRGLFLRGKNHTRVDGFADPAGDRAIGDIANNTTANATVTPFGTSNPGTHTHSLITPGGITQSSQTLTQSNVTSNTNDLTGASGAHTHTINCGDVETAPKHGVVNYFIKINR